MQLCVEGHDWHAVTDFIHSIQFLYIHTHIGEWDVTTGHGLFVL